MPTGMAHSAKAQPQAVALFVSDLHLQDALPRTTDCFLRFLREHAGSAQRLYLLGDLFDAWPGDDDLAAPLPRRMAGALAEVAASGVATAWIGGNRDFLVGQVFAQEARLQLLQEPHVVELAGKRLVLLHGDAQCTDDRDYQAFRVQVRDPAWQQAFLARPLAERKAIVANLRERSRAAQRDKTCEIMDVNEAAIAAVFEQTQAEVMVHGHTHRPAVHRVEVAGATRTRIVLPDWDCEQEPARGGWLALLEDGSLRRYRTDGSLEDAV